MLAQQDSFQRAAEPTQHAAEAAGSPANSPQSDHGPGALAQAAVPVAAAGRGPEGESMQAHALMPAATDQAGAMVVSLTHVHSTGSCMLLHKMCSVSTLLCHGVKGAALFAMLLYCTCAQAPSATKHACEIVMIRHGL